MSQLPHVTARVVTLSSTAHQRGKIDLLDLNWETRSYSPRAAYCQSKLANLMFAYELQRWLAGVGSSLRSYACHPGYAATGLQSHTGSRLQGALMALGNKVIAQSDEMGALPTMFAATQDLPGGSYVGPDGFLQMRGRPTVARSTKASKDQVVAAKLWDKSEELTGVSFPLRAATA